MNYFYDREGARSKYITVREFALWWGVSHMTVWRYLHAGMPSIKMGDHTNFLLMIPLTKARVWLRSSTAIVSGKVAKSKRRTKKPRRRR